ncbi:MAG: FliA/WhiG family RNA polymerase sigma factor [Acidimicrobiales bacterium]
MASTIGGISAEQRCREDELVRRHLRLVGYAVSDLATKVPKHVSRSDLTSAGMEGLAQAARSFDPARGIAFDRYAATRIRGALLDELRRRDWASRSVRARARQVGAVTDALTTRLGRIPTDGEVAQAAAMDRSAVSAVQADVYRAVVLNYEALVTGVDSEGDVPAATDTPDGVLIDRERKAYLLDSVGALPERLRRVVIGYFFEERPMQELADELGVTESRISQMRAEALSLLRDGMNSQLDPELLPVEKPTGRVARRKAAYYEAVANRSDYRSRLTAASA